MRRVAEESRSFVSPGKGRRPPGATAPLGEMPGGCLDPRGGEVWPHPPGGGTEGEPPHLPPEPQRARFPTARGSQAGACLSAPPPRRRRPAPETPILAASEFLIHRNHEIIRVYCIRQLSFRIICYTAIGN